MQMHNNNIVTYAQLVIYRMLTCQAANKHPTVYHSINFLWFCPLQNEYSDIDQIAVAFEEKDSYWVPASDASELYKQLSTKKYREIDRQGLE